MPGMAFSAATTLSRLACRRAVVSSTCSCGPSMAASAASWTKAGTLVTEFCWKMSMAVIRSLLATHQPMRKPVMM